MRPQKTILLPKAAKSPQSLGQNMKLARIRMMCERAGVSHATLTAIAQGNPSVSMAGYMSVLFCLNMHADVEKVASRAKYAIMPSMKAYGRKRGNKS